MFWAHLTVLRLITSVWDKTSKILYLREFSAQVSQIVFSANLTILRLHTTVWSKTSKISYLREFSEQVSQIVFWVHLTVLRLITVVISRKTVKSTQKTIFDFCALNSRRYDIFEVLLHTVVWGKTSKISYLREFSAQVSQIVFSDHLTVLRLIPTVWDKTSNI